MEGERERDTEVRSLCLPRYGLANCRHYLPVGPVRSWHLEGPQVWPRVAARRPETSPPRPCATLAAPSATRAPGRVRQERARARETKSAHWSFKVCQRSLCLFAISGNPNSWNTTNPATSFSTGMRSRLETALFAPCMLLRASASQPVSQPVSQSVSQSVSQLISLLSPRARRPRLPLSAARRVL